MADIEMSINGGAALERKLAEIAQHLGKGAAVRVGFLAGATYPADANQPNQGGLSVAQVAFWNEFGTTRAPPRPFFRGMIERESPQWGDKLARIVKRTDYRSDASMKLMGEGIKNQLQRSINEFSSPPLAPSTIKRKGFSKPLVDTAVMIRAVDYEVQSGAES